MKSGHTADYACLTRNGRDILVGTHQSEMLFDMVRKNGYTVQIINLLCNSELLEKSVVMVYEDYHVVSEGNHNAINEHQLIEVLAANWAKVDQLLLAAYHGCS